MQIYLDNSATTKCYPEVVSLVASLMSEDYGNPSSAHKMGFTAEKHVREAKERIARTLKIKPSEIVFTSGGTESDNMAILGAARAYQRSGRHIITTVIEHPAVLETVKALEKDGYEVTLLPVDETGTVSVDKLKEAIRDDTILVSVMAVNNETGSVQPLKEIGQIIKARNKNTLFHVDAVQGYGKIPIDVKACGIDLLSVSGHKIHAPKGIGFLYIKEGTKMIPLITGGGHQRGLRSGTENVPGEAGLGLAAQMMFTDNAEKIQRMRALRSYFIKEIVHRLEDVRINGQDEETNAPHIISLSVRGVKAEVLLHALEDEGIYVSAGSACSTNHPGTSSTLSAMGLDKEWLDSTIRISMSELTTRADMDDTLIALEKTVPLLRRFVAR